jgi:transcriptional regulator with XRE-family HTH domain
MSSMDREVDRILTLLRNKIRERGFTQLEVQDKLDWGRSYISQLLTRQKSLRVEQVLMILETIRVEPREFYAELYQFPRPEVRLRNLDDYADPARGEMTPAKVLTDSVDKEDRLPEDFLRNYRELRGLVRALVQLLVEKEVVSLEDVAEKAMAAEPKRRK